MLDSVRKTIISICNKDAICVDNVAINGMISRFQDNLQQLRQLHWQRLYAAQ